MESDIEYFKVQKTEIGSSEKIISKRKTFKNEKIATCYFNAKVLLENNEPALAVNLLRFCASNDSFNSYILDSLYESLRKSFQLDEAEKVAEQNLNYNYSLKRCFELANIYFFNDRDEEALKLYFDCLSNIIEDQLVLFEIYKNMANIYVKFREFDSAEEYYYKAYQINNNSDLLLVNIGVLEFQKKDLEKSRHCFRRAIEINNKNDKAWVGLAMTHIEYGDRDLSWGNLIKALDLNSNNKTALILMCQFYNKTEKNITCKEYLLKYLEKNNFDGEVSILLIQNLIHAGEYENAYLESFKNYIWNPKNEENKKVYIELKSYLEGAV